MNYSTMQRLRYNYKPKMPDVFYKDFASIKPEIGKSTAALTNQEELKELFPNTYGMPVVKFVEGKSGCTSKPLKFGVILSGGQAPGGHNVISGLYDALKKSNKNSKLYGFLYGPEGLVKGNYIEIKKELIDKYRNTGGFDIIGSGRAKIETEEQVADSIKNVKKLGLDALVIIGGDDSNTNAAFLAKYFIKAELHTKVIGVPKTIDGDLKNEYIEISFGFDTATKLYSELIGNICRDVNSARKYWHFIKLMGRSASHIALECALKTQPNVCLIGEELAEKKWTLKQVTEYITDIIVKRSQNGENFGVVLVPEGIIEFIPEMDELIEELNDLMAANAASFTKLKTFTGKLNWLKKKLSKKAFNLFDSLPETISLQLLMDRDPHGNVQVSRIETEKLLISLVTNKIKELKKEGKFNGKFSTYAHFFGYEGRSAFPSNFDSDYCYTLGFTAFLLAANGFSGYIASVQNLTDEVKYWQPYGVPLSMMMTMEKRKGKTVPVIKKSLIDLNGKPFKEFEKNRDNWAINTVYRFPGAIQYFGDSEVCEIPTKTLLLEKGNLKQKRKGKKAK
ncbi:diphosphate--fructose-6-phosphate 1-phosphotransferase [Treponema pedis]|uniref:diphosphate--fructose-6-phosphate 1-phosphotransferase n=1 Tax=Treponema pedis TaxID=409322 RepID=UPI00040DAD18|nr:diphosphate--fructose-6-phosphate 1-phosphotransferase [Treponema pedis]